MAEEQYITEQNFLDRMRDFRKANDARYKYKYDDSESSTVIAGLIILDTAPSTIEGAMWLSVD